MPSSKGQVGKGLPTYILALALLLAASPARAFDMERDTWLLPSQPEVIQPPRGERPAYEPLEFAGIAQTGNDRAPEYASDLEAELIAAAAREDRAAVEKLLAEGANPSRAGDEYGNRALVRAVERGNVELVRLLLDAGADPDLKGNGMTPLGLAALKGQARIAHMLLRAGADPDLKGSDGNTPLFNAALMDHVAVVRALLSHRPDFELFNRAGQHNMEGLTALGIAALEGNVASLGAMLEAGADPDALDKDKRTALFYALFRGQRGAVSMLIQHGADAGSMSVDAY